MSTYIVWREDSCRKDGHEIQANYEREAVMIWAEWYDARAEDPPIVGGEKVRVFAAADKRFSEPMLFEVWAEMKPAYFASLQLEGLEVQNDTTKA